jgi:hypothetical protein
MDGTWKRRHTLARTTSENHLAHQNFEEEHTLKVSPQSTGVIRAINNIFCILEQSFLCSSRPGYILFCCPSIVNRRVVALAIFAFQHSTVSKFPKRRLPLYHEIFNCTRCDCNRSVSSRSHLGHHASCIIPACDQYTLSLGVSLSLAS